MNDRKLLEYAAKAAGINLKPMEIKNVTYQGDDKFIGYMADSGQCPRGWFDPLTDDGDALRLAVKLRLCVDNCIGEEGERKDAIVGNEIGQVYSVFADEFHGDDPYAATRRAIVRAAAEIGKAMQ